MRPALRTAALLLGAAAVILFLHGAPALGVQDKDKEKGKEKDKEALIPGPEVLRAEGELTKDDPKDKAHKDQKEDDRSAHHLYTYKMVAGKTYIIECKSKEIDSYLRLEDSAGKQLAEDDDSGGYPDAKIVFKCPKSETYRIIVTTYDSKSDKSYGNYELTVRLAGGTTLAFKKGKVQVEGQLAATDKRDKVHQNKYCKEYTIRFKAGKTYQIDMVSGAIDSWLRLEDADGKQLAEDDDSGGCLNARITFNCQKDGVYRISCTTFVPNTTGPYTLMVTEQ
jgi:serine protease Do